MADHGHQEDAADSVDWRKLGAVGEVKNQGPGCLCWSFCAISAIESAHFIHTKELISLSEQYLIDCDEEFNRGFDMGQVRKAFKFILKNGGGVPSEKNYPYKGKKETCQEKRVAATIHGYKNVYPPFNEKVMMEAVRKQPITAEIDCLKIRTIGKTKEIFRYEPRKTWNHNVLIVGFGSENGVDYWIIKGAWGEEWGDGGYLRIERNVSHDREGTLGIARNCYYPLIKGFNM